jgi:outer membrane protein assembly factor BamB
LVMLDKSTMAPAGTALSSSGAITAPAIGDGALYVLQATANQLHAIDSALHTDRWVYGGSAQTAPITTIAAPTTEPTLAADGTLYFGDSGGRVYAIITDTPPAPFHPGDWPHVGFDNCNSNHANNPGYVCQ